MTTEPDPLASLVPLVATLGMRTVRQGSDECVLELDWRPELCTVNGLLHGGVLMALADTAGAVVAFANLPEGAVGTSTIESKTNFLAGVKEGATLVATARALHAGRTTIVVETELRDGTGRLVGKTTQTQSVLTPKG